jgi:hypothetical protein
MEGLAEFNARIASTTFKALLLDYDGTVCGASRRFDGPDAETSKLLTGVLALGVPLGVATGRGDSVRRDLRSAIERKYWRDVIIGYHNAGEIGDLSEDSVPTEPKSPTPQLEAVQRVVEQHPILSRLQVTTSVGTSQVSVRSSEIASARLRDLVASALAYDGLAHLEVVQSSHSVDVLAPGVSKLNLLERLEERVGDPAILCIGDRGRWPGNDYSILATPYSLSVDEVSADPRTCWNLAPRGLCRVSALHWYLAQLVSAKGGVRLALKG